MTARPCIDCGEPTPGTRCPDCQAERARQRPRKARGHVHENPARWKALSARARRLQPFCLDCGSTVDLTADHVIPVSERPDLALRIENVAVRCRRCNGRKAGRPPSDAERREVETRLKSRRVGRRVDLTTRGGTPSTPGVPSPSQSKFASVIT